MSNHLRLPFHICLMLTYDHIQTGAKALVGKSEYIHAKIFEAVEYDRKITGKDKSIMCYDPEADKTSAPLWEYQNSSITDEPVPKGMKWKY
jgi:hypothetical protein